MSRLSRRDILKLSAALAGGAALSSVRPLSHWARGLAQTTGKPNFIVLVLDAMSARNLSLLGYTRPTTPALERFSQGCTVYHNHYAGGNFTSSGTATIFTGLYPWTHRALTLGGIVARSLERKNIFNFLGEDYTRVGFSHNQLVHLLLGQFSRDLDVLLDRTSFSIQKNVPTPEDHLVNDLALGYYTFADFLGASEFYLNPGSLSLGLADMFSYKKSEIKATPNYPRGYPYSYHTYFRIEDVLAGLAKTIKGLAANPSPFFTYFHLLPPHSPYNPKRDFIEPFINDGITFPVKPEHPLAVLDKAPDKLDRLRMFYDSFVTNVDYEVGRFIHGLEKTGILDSSYLIITSDHGELFERGDYGHGSPLMYEPVVHVPLIIHAPGQTERRDVHSLTSNTDLLPTILSLAGREIPSSTEGRLLPGLGGTEDAERSVFTVYAKENSSFLPLDTSVMSMRKGEHQLIYYRGYPGYDDRMELYDLENDAEEMQDLSEKDIATAKRMREELLDMASAADRPYQRRKQGS